MECTQREKESPFEERSFPSPSALPHLFPNLFKYAFSFFAARKKRKGGQENLEQNSPMKNRELNSKKALTEFSEPA